MYLGFYITYDFLKFIEKLVKNIRVLLVNFSIIKMKIILKFQRNHQV